MPRKLHAQRLVTCAVTTHAWQVEQLHRDKRALQAKLKEMAAAAQAPGGGGGGAQAATASRAATPPRLPSGAVQTSCQEPRQ
eukprot:COSAG01_NODE_782_length_13631_cov_73.763450_12_plen_82_part_00